MEVRIFKVNGSEKTECPRTKNLHGPQPEECKGEICMRGRHIMAGYLANPDMGPEHVEEIKRKNREAIDSVGWLHSGDMGVKDFRGMIKIVGRYKELIIGAGGENIAPVPIEDEIKKNCEGVVSNVLMIGDKRKFNTCLITLACKGATGEKAGTNELDGPAASLVPGVTTIEQAAASEQFLSFIEDAIKDTNNNGQVCPSNASKIGKFTILPIDFSVEGDELTSTFKSKRGVIEKKYAKAIDAMYLTEGGSMFVPYVG
jgi:long-chain-fatty-acid--CoA ligase ACSBG